MTTLFKILFSALLIMCFSSCNDVIQIKLDEGSKLYVIDGFINNLRTNQTIRVNTNDSYFSNREAPAVSNANVVLVDLTTNNQYIFNYTSNGNYVYSLASTDTLARVNHQYQLKVTIDGNVYSSLPVIQKRPAVIDSISAIYDDGQNPFNGAKDTYQCLLFAKDLGGPIPDYYWIKTFRNDTLFNEPFDINTCIDGTGGAVLNTLQDTIDFTPPATFIGNKRYLKNDKCKVEVHSLSRETYFFLVQAVTQINNGGLFATTPENVKTNIVTPQGAKTKAIGWFNVASVADKTKLIPQ